MALNCDAWDTEKFVDIPSEIEEKAKSVKIKEEFLTIDTGFDTLKIFYREVHPESSGFSDVLFLHGQSFSSETWKDIGTLQLMSAMGCHAVAIDIPGYGKSEKGAFGCDDLIHEVIEHLHLSAPIIISPSMSGGYSLPYLMEHGTKGCKAFIPIAPVGTDNFSQAQYQSNQVPAIIVYGTKDEQLGKESLKNLSHMPNHVVFPLDDAGHACYMNKTPEWHRLLYNFILALKKKE